MQELKNQIFLSNYVQFNYMKKLMKIVTQIKIFRELKVLVIKIFKQLKLQEIKIFKEPKVQGKDFFHKI